MKVNTITIKELIGDLQMRRVDGDINQIISSIHLDSREVQKGGCFVAVKGLQSDGHDFIQQAIDKGAKCIVYQESIETILHGICYLKVENSSKTLAHMASNFFGRPSEKLSLVGVTGTNGKTSIVSILYQCFTEMGYSVGLISTIKVAIENDVFDATHTTPNSIALNSTMQKMEKRGCDFVFMEVSSHSIDQNRIYGLDFDGMIFTNLSHDHLDYHKTFDHYRNAKQKAFTWLKPKAFALFNRDDKNGKIMVQNSQATKYSYAMKAQADFKSKLIEQDFRSMLLEVNGSQAYYALSGVFNAYNLTAAFGACLLLGIDQEVAIKNLSKVLPPSGRFDLIERNNIIGIVDFAHTPDALKNVLSNINLIRTRNEKLITIIGCGGNRDKEKRPLMGQIAASGSDQVIFTSDNPRDEDPERIIAAMSEGVLPQDNKKTLAIANRKEAIKTAVMLSNAGDIILLAGKGHENYQEINGVKHAFNDYQELNNQLELLSNQ